MGKIKFTFRGKEILVHHPIIKNIIWPIMCFIVTGVITLVFALVIVLLPILIPLHFILYYASSKKIKLIEVE